MTVPKRTHRRRPTSADRERWAELADLVLIVAREIQFRGYPDQQAVPLSQSEGMVMRYLHDEPSPAPSRIAAATGLQRTNLSAVLRGLEQKGLIERHTNTEDRRRVSVGLTERGKQNYTSARSEWARAVSAAAHHDTRNLAPALDLLRVVEAGLVSTRPPTPGRPTRLT